MSAWAVWLRPRRAARLIAEHEASLVLLINALIRTRAKEGLSQTRSLGQRHLHSVK